MNSLKKFIKNHLFEDYRWSPEFQLLKKYESDPTIYVRFSSRPIIKKVFTSSMKKSMNITNHIDPSGMYAFPIRFVLENYKNPNFNSFFLMTYVAFLKDLSANKIIVSDPITYAQAKEIYEKMFEVKLEEALQNSDTLASISFLVFNEFSPKSKNAIEFIEKLKSGSPEPMNNKHFFKITRMETGVLKNGKFSAKNASGDVQRIRWIKAGFDAIEDKNGIIFDKTNEEKEQIIFLTENSYDIIETYSKESQEKAGLQNYNKKKIDSFGIPSRTQIVHNNQRLPYILRRTAVFVLENILNDAVTKITSKNEEFVTLLDQLKNVSQAKVANEKQEYSNSQILVGIGNKYIVVALGFKNPLADNQKKDEENYTFEVAVFDKNSQKLFKNLEIHSTNFSSLDEYFSFIQSSLKVNESFYMKKNINLLENKIRNIFFKESVQNTNELFLLTVDDVEKILNHIHNRQDRIPFEIVLDYLTSEDPSKVSYIQEVYGKNMKKIYDIIKKRLDEVGIQEEEINFVWVHTKEETIKKIFSDSPEINEFVFYIHSRNSPSYKSIGILYKDGKFIIFEGNDEADGETIQLANKIVYGNKPRYVRVYGSHGSKVVDEIEKTGMLPTGLYVSPDKSYAEGYWGEDRILFSGIIDANNVSQESEVDWKVLKPIPIKAFKYE